MRKVIPGQRLIFTLGLVLFVMGGLAGGYEGELLSPEAVAPEGEQPPTYTPLSEFQKRHRLSNSGFLIRGRIRTLDKRPISGADVSLYDLFDWKTNRLTGLRRSTSSNEMGHYQMHIDAPFKGTLTVGKPGFAPIQEDVNLASPRTYIKSYTLEDSPARTEGRVFDDRNRPIAGATISVMFSGIYLVADPSQLSPRVVFSDCSGNFTVDNLPEGRAVVSAFGDEYLQEFNQIELRSEKAQHVRFTLSRAQVFGFVVKNEQGETISGAHVSVIGSSPLATRSDELGRIGLQVAPDSGMLQCQVEARGYLTRRMAVDPDHPPKAVVLKEGPLFKGTVLSQSGYPLSEARVVLKLVTYVPQRKKTLPRMIERVSLSERTDEKGRFSVRLSYPRVASIDVSRSGYLEKVIEFDQDSTRLHTEIRLKPNLEGGGIYGRVIDADRDSVERFDLWLHTLFGKRRAIRRSFEDLNGVFSVVDLPSGDFRLEVRSRLGRDTLITQTVDRVTVRKGMVYGELLICLKD